MMTSSLLSTFWMSGGSASTGSWSRIPDTRSRTSFAAPSMSRSMSNSMVIFERPSSLTDSMVRIPSTPETRSSMSWVMRVSTTLAAAPG